MAEKKSGKRVLVVDDSGMMRLIVCELVEQLGHEAIEAQNGFDAIAFAEKYEPDMIVLDVIMPEKSGFETLRELRGMEKFRTTPIVMLTTETYQEFVDKAREEKANDFLTKPVDLDELEEKMRQYLGS